MYAKFGKRALDVAISLFALLLLSPVLLLLAIGSRLSSPGPATFKQRRIGRGGETFQFYKLRSMPADTRDVPSHLLNQVEIRPFGKFIRRTNLDELPQLWNVLRGDMSIVGPRPCIPSQQELVDRRQANGALSVRPGLTGLAQVNSYDGMSLEEKVRYDGEYAREVTLWNDIVIIMQTFGYLTRPPPVY